MSKSLSRFLPVVDDFRTCRKSFSVEKNDKESEGFFLIQQQIQKGTWNKSGVKVMAIEAGADFNTDFHEAITQVPAPDEKLKGKIVDVVEKGYLLNEKVIRFAKVVVGS
ncbi:MAG: nucleotide exchange factor GrpE [Cyclobacteriaceae bacterium]